MGRMTINRQTDGRADKAYADISGLTEMLAEGIMYPGAAFRNYMEDWDWYQGVALFGLYQLYQETGRTQIREYLEGWFREHIKKGLPAMNINTVSPLLTLSYLYEESGNPEYFEICRGWAEQIMRDMPRTEEGGFQHITRDSENRGQLWDDTLYMTVLFIGRMGMLLHDDTLVQESIRQFLVHLKYLTDVESGLFYHGWTFEGRHHFAGALWGRGNAWYTAGLVDYLDMVETPEGVRRFLLTSLERQAEALARFQDADGMWHTLIDHPESSYAEASATAGFSYGILKAVRKKWLDGRFLEMGQRGMNAVIRRIGPDGILGEVSDGTCVGDTLDYYRTIPRKPQPYGQSMALLLLIEGSRECG
ncbi:MAG: glycoside hydrolase family 88 protein [Roseburia sp.]|nr:glycoside hydrolase family 88 protein [Roseburia sp.]MCM1098181.1 glycoside hydrolase family 88 protein [Ruminococcus flavefaciens]MCM1232089.1 glycoside hydrolase family 88 protein [Ruminococcus flavefaciens]